MNVRLVFVSILLSGLLSGCGQDRRAWTAEDAWGNPLPAGTRLNEWAQVERDRVHEVGESRLAEAEALLQDVSSVQISSAQAAEFVGAPLPDVPGTTPYLVRGLLLNRATGGFTVYVLEDQVTIYHRSLGRSAVPMIRQPLVVQLQKPPQEVYVAVSMAE